MRYHKGFFLIREYAKWNERVIGDSGKYPNFYSCDHWAVITT